MPSAGLPLRGTFLPLLDPGGKSISWRCLQHDPFWGTFPSYVDFYTLSLPWNPGKGVKSYSLQETFYSSFPFPGIQEKENKKPFKGDAFSRTHSGGPLLGTSLLLFLTFPSGSRERERSEIYGGNFFNFYLSLLPQTSVWRREKLKKPVWGLHF